MKFSKQQLKRIIKEEKAKLLNETTPRINAEYQSGNYASLELVSAIEKSIEELYGQVNNAAAMDLGDDQEADFATVNVVTMTLIDALERLGMIAQARMLERTLD